MATGQEIVDEVRIQLNDGDAGNLRWGDTEMLGYVNAAQRQIVLLLPEANVLETSAAVTTADSRQSIPAGGIKFLGAWNYDNVASTRGPALTILGMDSLNSSFPEWSYPAHQAAYMNQYPTIEAEHTDVMFEHAFHDPREPKVYYLFPPPILASSPFLLTRYSALPTVLATLAGTYDLGDEYINAAVEYVTFRALMKEGRYSVDPERRLEWWNNFRMALGLKPEIEKRVDPALGRAGGEGSG